MVAPAAFSVTLVPVNVMAVCASLTFCTLTVKVLAIWLPPASVAVTLTFTLAADS